MSAFPRAVFDNDEAPDVDELRDRMWLAQLQRGDLQAYESLFRAYFVPLWRFAYRYVRNREAAEDIVQDVFTRFWEQHQTVAPKGTVRAYLFRSVRNYTIDVHKHDLVERRTVAHGVHDREQLTIGDPDLLPDERLFRAQVRSFVDDLPEPRRTAVILRYYEGLSFAEIAAILEISVKSAEMLTARAVKALQNRILHR
jgi:RNA polymerase sigma-70 factor (ECF subfamily)